MPPANSRKRHAGEEHDGEPAEHDHRGGAEIGLDQDERGRNADQHGGAARARSSP